MKSIRSFSLFSLITFTSILVFSCTELLAEQIILELKPDQYEIIEIPGEYHEISMEQHNSTSTPGHPILPYKIIEVPLPENVNFDTIQIKVDNVGEINIDGEYKIKPAQFGIYDVEDDIYNLNYIPQKGSLYFDESIYNTDAFFPENPITMLTPTTRGIGNGELINLVRLVYNPFQYNPQLNKIKLIINARVSISYDTGGTIPLPWDKLAPPSSYVIITTEKIKNNSDELINFVNFKTQQGHSVRVVTENDFNQVTGAFPNRRAEKIRQWLRLHYRKAAIEYVLLIGNPDPDDPMYSHDIGDELNDPYYHQDNYIPMKQIWHALPGRGGRAGGCDGTNPLTEECDNTFISNAPLPYWGDSTDWYYADLTGNWDIDGDGFYGETPWMRQDQIEQTPLAGSIDINNFSARWNGTINLTASEDVLFELRQWQGARLFVNDTLILDHWPQTQRESDKETTVSLAAGNHDVRVEYYQNTGHGHIFARMNGRVLNGFSGSYYNNSTLSGPPVVTEKNASLWKNWETCDHASTGGVDLDAEISVGRVPVYDNDYKALDAILSSMMLGVNRSVERKILLPMKPMDDNTPSYNIGEKIVEDITTPNSYAASRMYEETYGLVPSPEYTFPTPSDIVDAWNAGFGMITWMTHGTWRWAAGILDVKYQLPLLGDSYRPIIFAASCHNGHIYLPDCYPGCTLDLNNFDRADGRGSLSYVLLRDVASAVVSSSEVSTYFSRSFYQNDLIRDNANFAYLYTKEIIANRSSTGVALKNIKYTHFGAPNDQMLNYHQQLIYNLYGDPSLFLLNNSKILNMVPFGTFGRRQRQQ
ncbi:MAG: hypothetical protein K9K37_04260 [Desulfocapsa sp.]|nr:hypothetical protein [Desulfocapsa sp.]